MSQDPNHPMSPDRLRARSRRYAFLALLALLVLASPIVASVIAWIVLKLLFAVPGMREWEREEQAR